MPSLAHPDAIHLGLDVHRDSISVAILNPGNERPDVERIFSDEESVRRLIGRFENRSLSGPATKPAQPATTWPVS